MTIEIFFEKVAEQRRIMAKTKITSALTFRRRSPRSALQILNKETLHAITC